MRTFCLGRANYRSDREKRKDRKKRRDRKELRELNCNVRDGAAL
jgi:hypothetical protein